MTVAIEDPSNPSVVYLYTKGADSAIFAILDEGIEQPFKEQTGHHLH